jgi:hypothetical protein
MTYETRDVGASYGKIYVIWSTSADQTVWDITGLVLQEPVSTGDVANIVAFDHKVGILGTVGGQIQQHQTSHRAPYDRFDLVVCMGGRLIPCDIDGLFGGSPGARAAMPRFRDAVCAVCTGPPSLPYGN